MTKYNVHIFREMRLYFPGIEADSPAEAAETGRNMDTADADDITSCDGENLGALVDIAGDTDFANSEIIDFAPQRLLDTGSMMLAALQAILPYAENELASLQEARRRDGGLEDEVAACEAAVEQARKVLVQVVGGAA